MNNIVSISSRFTHLILINPLHFFKNIDRSRTDSNKQNIIKKKIQHNNNNLTTHLRVPIHNIYHTYIMPLWINIKCMLLRERLKTTKIPWWKENHLNNVVGAAFTGGRLHLRFTSTFSDDDIHTHTLHRQRSTSSIHNDEVNFVYPLLNNISQ